MDCDVLFVMGVSGCGKSTVGRELAVNIGFTFKDGDDFHSKSNVAKMKAGTPLDDTDRMPWLISINNYCRTHKNIVVACSALRLQYRNLLRKDIRCKFIFLDVSRELLEIRLKNRKNHYMPITLLDSQLATLEKPSKENDVISMSITEETPNLIEIIVKQLKHN